MFSNAALSFFSEAPIDEKDYGYHPDLPLATRFAAWATPHIQRWHRQRHVNRSEGERHLAIGNFSEAEKHLTLAVAEAEQRRYSAAKKIALRLQLAQAQRAQGKLNDAERSVRCAMEDAPNDPTLQAICLDLIAEVHHDRDDHSASAKAIQDAMALDASDPQATARRTSQLAIARRKLGRPEDAIELLEKSIALHETAYGRDHLETGHRMGELGALYREQGKHADAQRCFRRALQIHEACCGADSHEATQDLSNLAASLEASGDLDGAVAQYERAMRLKERAVGGDMTELAEMEVTVARLYIHWKRYGQARELMAQAMGRLAGRGGRRLATAFETMAQLEEASGRPADAVALREKALVAAADPA
jgi:tetratricopeptide (TPR) repeat protein